MCALTGRVGYTSTTFGWLSSSLSSLTQFDVRDYTHQRGLRSCVARHTPKISPFSLISLTSFSRSSARPSYLTKGRGAGARSSPSCASICLRLSTINALEGEKKLKIEQFSFLFWWDKLKKKKNIT